MERSTIVESTAAALVRAGPADVHADAHPASMLHASSSPHPLVRISPPVVVTWAGYGAEAQVATSIRGARTRASSAPSGDPEVARYFYEGIVNDFTPPDKLFLTTSYERLGRIHEAAGRTREAIYYYDRFVKEWGGRRLRARSRAGGGARTPQGAEGGGRRVGTTKPRRRTSASREALQRRPAGTDLDQVDARPARACTRCHGSG